MPGARPQPHSAIPRPHPSIAWPDPPPRPASPPPQSARLDSLPLPSSSLPSHPHPPVAPRSMLPPPHGSLPSKPTVKKGVLASAPRARHLIGFSEGLRSVPAPKDVQEMLAERRREDGDEEPAATYPPPPPAPTPRFLPLRRESSIAEEWDNATSTSSTPSVTNFSARGATAEWINKLGEADVAAHPDDWAGSAASYHEDDEDEQQEHLELGAEARCVAEASPSAAEVAEMRDIQPRLEAKRNARKAKQKEAKMRKRREREAQVAAQPQEAVYGAGTNGVTTAAWNEAPRTSAGPDAKEAASIPFPSLQVAQSYQQQPVQSVAHAASAWDDPAGLLDPEPTASLSTIQRTSPADQAQAPPQDSSRNGAWDESLTPVAPSAAPRHPASGRHQRGTFYKGQRSGRNYARAAASRGTPFTELIGPPSMQLDLDAWDSAYDAPVKGASMKAAKQPAGADGIEAEGSAKTQGKKKGWKSAKGKERALTTTVTAQRNGNAGSVGCRRETKQAEQEVGWD
ncbi:hypothetical protein BDZ90DRAFT_232227 [Jaminaea rosea]|uniref:Uncharacterized protein n=1 Tax=Jaminaea rosea TaxID=1569628 RepID=A0A316UXI1_9BASI|nr:hypothetical protein BDZ90DRAFT_232227 [Jaminaea rosea]PWN27845.1 hypothetical protein BDZ90DRAFT_232227 [Jaminaea rosea]